MKRSILLGAGLTALLVCGAPQSSPAQNYGRGSYGGNAYTGGYPSRPVYQFGWSPGFYSSYPVANPTYNDYPERPTTRQSFYQGAQPRGVDENAAQVRIRVPHNARLWIQDQETQQRGGERLFFSPPLASGRNFYYTLKAVWTDESGREASRTEQVVVHAGDFINIDLRVPSQEAQAQLGGPGQSVIGGNRGKAAAPSGVTPAGGTVPGSTTTGPILAPGATTPGQPTNDAGRTPAPNIGGAPNAPGRPAANATTPTGPVDPTNPTGTTRSGVSGTRNTTGTGLTDRPVGSSPTAPGISNVPGASPTAPGTGTGVGRGTSSTGTGAAPVGTGAAPSTGTGASGGGGSTGSGTGGTRGGSSR